MGKLWEDLPNGRKKLTITPDDPADTTPPTVYKGTVDEIMDMLADSQLHANRRLNEFRRGQNGNGTPPAPPQREAAPLSAADRLQVVADLQNPGSVDKAVTRVVESVMGPIDKLRERNQRQDAQDQQAKAVAAASEFVAETPEWDPSNDFNKRTLTNYMRTMGLDPTNTAHYKRAFEELRAENLLKLQEPTDDNEELEDLTPAERNAPALPSRPKAPTRFSTGVTQRDISGAPPKPTNRLKYTREQLANMSAADYARLMRTDRAELERSETYYAQQDAQKSRRRAG